MTPTICRFVKYTLSEDDVAAINRRRTDGASIGLRKNAHPLTGDPAWPAGAQAHIGNQARAGQAFPALVVAVNDDGYPNLAHSINLQVFLDGTDVLWQTSVREGDTPGTWAWPRRDD